MQFRQLVEAGPVPKSADLCPLNLTRQIEKRPIKRHLASLVSALLAAITTTSTLRHQPSHLHQSQPRPQRGHPTRQQRPRRRPQVKQHL